MRAWYALVSWRVGPLVVAGLGVPGFKPTPSQALEVCAPHALCLVHQLKGLPLTVFLSGSPGLGA